MVRQEGGGTENGAMNQPLPGPTVGIVMGSQSDWATMRQAADILDELGISYEARIVSAHRTPKRMADYAETARARGLKVIIAGAGGAACWRGCADCGFVPTAFPAARAAD